MIFTSEFVRPARVQEYRFVSMHPFDQSNPYIRLTMRQPRADHSRKMASLRTARNRDIKSVALYLYHSNHSSQTFLRFYITQMNTNNIKLTTINCLFPNTLSKIVAYYEKLIHVP